MAVTKREYIFGTFIISGLSLGLLLGAIGSQNWISGDITLSSVATVNTNIQLNYGLFRGEAVKQLSLETPDVNSLFVTCDFSENVCLVSCKTTHEARKAQISNLLQGCPATLACNANIDTCDSPTLDPSELRWLNAGVFVTNLTFLCISIVLASFSVLIGVYNTARIPAEPLLGIFGLFIWNCCTAFSNLMVLLVWGIHFSVDLSEKLSYTDTMQTEAETYRTGVGLSYWLVLVSLFCHLISPGLLILRQWLIDREPPPPTINIDKNTDDTIFLY